MSVTAILILGVALWFLVGFAVIVRREMREALMPARGAGRGLGKVLGGVIVAIGTELLTVVALLIVAGFGAMWSGSFRRPTPSHGAP